ncbi:hypothetical protein BV22DRAFT_415404 [Leucogyrophana mollusca]|uniref:Uncharacterized protein n=1 Tax=Leucogyrophana mollusca TaxID=85980 RepID=A0ACB8BLE0_9AGAM|nr:hypothetical protein BV22DRAFT_415404 [Leucogyrophana mollusca]
MSENPPTPNVIICGDSGSGKSSVINLISETHVAPISSGAARCTPHYVRYPVRIQGAPFNLYDTAELEKEGRGDVDIVAQLYKLMIDLEDGVSLLVFCMGGPRIRVPTYSNWQISHEIFGKNVPIVIVITHLEQDVPMDNCWRKNKATFHKYGMVPFGHACITATRGKKDRSGRYMYEDEYEESRVKVSKLIEDTALAVPWKINRIQWLSEIATSLIGNRLCEAPEILVEMVQRCSMSKEEARELAERLRGVWGQH